MSSFSVPLTRSAAVVEQLREEILSRALPPGTLLKDAELAARLGVSITPIREAITHLAAEGLVDIAPNRTRKVAELSQKQMLEVVDVMELLACEGFARGVANLTDEHVERLRQRFDEYEAALARSDSTAAAAAGADLSTIVVMAGGNRELQSLIDQVVTRALRLQPFGPDSPLWQPWRSGYRDVIGLIESGDRIGAVERYRQIYGEYRSALEALLWAQRTSSQPHNTG